VGNFALRLGDGSDVWVTIAPAKRFLKAAYEVDRVFVRGRQYFIALPAIGEWVGGGCVGECSQVNAV
jgi:hypothetical protein